MKQISSTDFRRAYVSESEPLEVTAYGKLIGTWFPAGTLPEPESDEPTPDEPERVSPEPPREDPLRPSIRPVKGQPKRLVATQKPIFDAAELRRQERERWSQIQSKIVTKR
jgi:hypothetical protein